MRSVRVAKWLFEEIVRLGVNFQWVCTFFEKIVGKFSCDADKVTSAIKAGEINHFAPSGANV